MTNMRLFVLGFLFSTRACMRHSPWCFAIVRDRCNQKAGFLLRKGIFATDP